MSLWRQLRWRIVAAQMLVVAVGVAALMLIADLLTPRVVAPALVPTVRAAISTALAGAALAATLAGLLTSLLLMQQILRPLRDLASSSRRIAGGHYDERVTVPASDELAEVARSFNQMAEALAQVEQQRVALIGNVAHELRTPLAGLEGYLQGVVDGVLPGDPSTFGAMQHELRRLRRLVDDLQTLSRVEAGQIELRLRPVELRPLVERVVAQLAPQAPEHQISIAGPEGGPALRVRADPDRLTQIMINLLGNAIRYTPPGGAITISLAAAGGQASVAVRDSGIGIAPAALPYLFERFYRADPSRSRASGGSGIGLTIARHLTWAMGGEISAASDGPGLGSTFTVTLPQA